MIEGCIQIFFILLSCFYLYHKLLNIEKHPFNIELYCYIYFAVCSCLLCFISKNIYYIFYYPALIILFFVFIRLYTQTHYKTALITTVIALGISLCAFTLSAVICYYDIVFIMHRTYAGKSLLDFNKACYWHHAICTCTPAFSVKTS